MAPQHIHLHIGAPKTGSTAIQRWLFEHRSDLAASGLLYPEVCLRGYGHHDLAFLIGGGYPEWASPQPLGLGVLQDQLRQAGALGLPQMLLSSEDFFLYPDPDRLRAFIEGALGRVGRFTVHAYLRRQQEVLPSWYNQLVKAQGYAGSFEDSVADFGDLWDYAARLAPWADAFGDAALSVHPYPAAGADIRAHFLGQLGLPDLSVESEPGEPTNARILRDVLEYQRVLNTLPLPTARKRAFHKPLIALSQAAPRPAALQDAPVASAQRLAEIEAAYADRNDEVARRYRGGEALFPPLLAAPTAAAEAPPYAGLSPEAVATITGWLLLHKDA